MRRLGLFLSITSCTLFLLYLRNRHSRGIDQSSLIVEDDNYSTGFLPSYYIQKLVHVRRYGIG